MYKDYSQAYLDIMDDDPSTQSYNSFLHLGTTITSANEETYKNIFKKERLLPSLPRLKFFFCLIGVYAISIIDALCRCRTVGIRHFQRFKYENKTYNN